MPLEDFTTYTEVDVAGNRLAVTSSRITVTNMVRSEDCYVYDDKGVDHFGDFEHLVTIRFTELTKVAGENCLFLVYVVSNAYGSYTDIFAANNGIIVYGYAGVPRSLHIKAFTGNGANDDGTFEPALDTDYYLTIKRDGTTATCKIYSDAARTNLLHTLTVTCVTTPYRYLTAVSNWKLADTVEVSGYVENLNLQEGVVHTKTFAETLALSDVVQKKPAKIFTESINLSDVYSRTWTLFRTYSEILTLNDFHLKKPSKTFPETLVLGDVLVKKTSKTFTETLNLSGVYSRVWNMYRIYLETLELGDTLSKKTFKTFLEELNLSDILQKKLSKTFTESISLSDVLTKKPSKIFTETLSLADVLTKKPSKTFTETLALSDIYSRKWTIYRTYVETLALREFLIKKPSKTFTETLNLRDLPRTWKINPLETGKLLLKLKHLEDVAGD